MRCWKGRSDADGSDLFLFSELEAEYCQAVCGIDQLALIIVQDGLAGLAEVEKYYPF